MSEYALPPSVLRSNEPHEIEVMGAKLLIREPTGQEFARFMAEHMQTVNGIATTKPTYAPALIELCVVEPKIENADEELRPAFIYALAKAIEDNMGGTDTEIKKGCGGSCSCSHLPTPQK